MGRDPPRGGGSGGGGSAEAHAALGESGPKGGWVGPAVVHLVGLKDSIARLDEGGIDWGEAHAIRDQLKDEVISGGKAVAVNEPGSRFPQGDTPDFALVVDLVCTAGAGTARAKLRAVERGAGGTIMGLGRVNVSEGEGVLGQVRCVRVASDAEVIILVLGGAGQQVACIGAFGVSTVDIHSRLAQHAQSIEIRPALTHPGSLQRADAYSPAHAPVAQAVGVFVQNYTRVKVSVPPGRRPIEQVHLHAGRRAVRLRGNVGAVESGAILSFGHEGVVSQAAAPEVVALKIAGRLGEAKLVEFVVHEVAQIKGFYDGRGGVIGRVLSGQVHGEVEYARGRALRTGQIGRVVPAAVGVGVHIVTQRLVAAVVDPACGGSVGVQRWKQIGRASCRERV